MRDAADDTNAQTLRSYELGAEVYWQKTRADRAQCLIDFMDRAVADLALGSEVLELGSGPGRDAVLLENRGMRVRRTDATMAFVAMMRADGYRAEVLDVLKDDPAGPYDLVYASAVLLHLSRAELASVLVKVRHALRPGGRLACTFKQGNGEAWSNAKLDLPRHYTYWQAGPLRALFEAAGWRLIEVRPEQLSEAWLMVLAEPETQ